MTYIVIKRQILFFLTVLTIAAIVGIGILKAGSTRGQTGYIKGNPGNSSIIFEDYDLEIKGWDNNGCTIFFLPSYIDIKKIDQSNSDMRIFNTDMQLLTDPLPGKIQDVFVCDENGDCIPWKIGVLSSENLYTMDIRLDGIDIDDIDHDVYNGAEVEIYSPSGKHTYYEKKAGIKGRGNSTWETEKKPYEIQLPLDVSLCGLKSSKKWVLLANAYDDTKILNKLAFDLSSAIGLENTTDADWIDLYINGEYQGNYLICKEPSLRNSEDKISNLEKINQPFFDPGSVYWDYDVKAYTYKENPPDVSGGYLIEKNWDQSLIEKPVGFYASGYCFTIKEPNNASVEETRYIQRFVEEVDGAIDSGTDLSGIDFFSFSRRFMLEEFLYNIDFSRTSYFFYKKQRNNTIFAGPCWDYDLACGRLRESSFNDYTGSLLNQKESEVYSEILDWDEKLLDNEKYRDRFNTEFKQIVPVFEDAYKSMVDSYKTHIRASVEMDTLRWRNIGGASYKGYYSNIENKYRHVKFFLNKRLEHLMQFCGINSEAVDINVNNNTIHRIVFKKGENGKTVWYVKDGTQLNPEDLPAYDKSRYRDGWEYEYNGLQFSYFIPVYEDITLVLD